MEHTYRALSSTFMIPQSALQWPQKLSLCFCFMACVTGHWCQMEGQPVSESPLAQTPAQTRCRTFVSFSRFWGQQWRRYAEEKFIKAQTQLPLFTVWPKENQGIWREPIWNNTKTKPWPLSGITRKCRATRFRDAKLWLLNDAVGSKL